MADFMRVQISSWLSTDPKLDRVTNTLYFRRNLPDMDAPEYTQLATDILAAYNVGSNIYGLGADRQQVRIYDLEDLEPRQPRAMVNSSVNTGAAGPREVALCLSFRGEQNVPRQRGRIYLGPFAPANLVARPAQSLRDAVHAFAGRLAGIGAADVDWCVHSPTTQSTGGSLGDSFKPVRHSWVDDAWDTQRSRGLPPTTRVTLDHNG